MPQPGGVSVSRLLLRRLRDVMAGGGSAQDRLVKIVNIVAGEMVTEVCSAYIMRPGEVLELFATKGLKAEAVHKTRLRVGEGLVGDIAANQRPLALAEAQSHPNFAYRPETGEEIYHSLMGVPVLRSGRVLGVLVVQNRTPRQYTEEEVETLETIATVLAELVASGELVTKEEMQSAEGIGLLPTRLEGTTLNAGLAMGQALLHEPRILLRQMVADDPRQELQRFRDAVDGMRTALDDMLASPDVADGGEHRDVLETYRMFADDHGWLNRITELIDTGLTAEAATQKVKDDTRARMEQIVDPYLRERVHDFEDLANRLIRHLVGETAAPQAMPEDTILVARNMGPAELLDYDRRRLRGVVIEEGSPTSHVAIVARALDIPVIGQVDGLLRRVEAGDTLVLDADNGQVFVRPADDIRNRVAENMQLRAQRRAMFAATRDLPAVTLDGVKVSLNINAGLLIDLPHLAGSGADGIGLYRTEIPFMVRDEFPDVQTQTEIYRRVLQQAGGKPVVFRTLDVGGDKVLPYWRGETEENPAMGWRAIRIGLDRPLMLRQQVRALLAAASGGDLQVMFPMISEVGEFDTARRMVNLELERVRQRGVPPPTSLKVGAMFEVPALAFQMDALMKRVDFLSIGSNDLRQFLFASDRGSARLASRYDNLSPAMLELLRRLTGHARPAGVPLSLCGEMAGNPLDAMALLAIGFRSLSMAAPSIGPVRQMIRSIDLSLLTPYVMDVMSRGGGGMRVKLATFARDHGVTLG
jgi:phosphotransferase system, enzyme I, PtsP